MPHIFLIFRLTYIFHLLCGILQSIRHDPKMIPLDQILIGNSPRNDHRNPRCQISAEFKRIIVPHILVPVIISIPYKPKSSLCEFKQQSVTVHPPHHLYLFSCTLFRCINLQRHIKIPLIREQKFGGHPREMDFLPKLHRLRKTDVRSIIPDLLYGKFHICSDSVIQQKFFHGIRRHNKNFRRIIYFRYKFQHKPAALKHKGLHIMHHYNNSSAICFYASDQPFLKP